MFRLSFELLDLAEDSRNDQMSLQLVSHPHKASASRQSLIRVAREMIANLHWADFDTLVDLVFARSGWQGVPRVGEYQADVDLVIELPTTGERAFVELKSKANLAVLDDYIDRYRRDGAYDRMFFVSHGAPVRSTHKMPFSTRRSSTRGTPRGLGLDHPPLEIRQILSLRRMLPAVREQESQNTRFRNPFVSA